MCWNRTSVTSFGFRARVTVFFGFASAFTLGVAAARVPAFLSLDFFSFAAIYLKLPDLVVGTDAISFALPAADSFPRSFGARRRGAALRCLLLARSLLRRRRWFLRRHRHLLRLSLA